MKKTIQDRLAEALIARGEREVGSLSGKYRTFTREAGGFYFLGYGGALRHGRCSSKSYSITQAGKQRILTGDTRPIAVAQAETNREYLAGLSATEHKEPEIQPAETSKELQKTTLRCETCGAEAYPTPTGWQCSAYSNHKCPLVIGESETPLDE